MYNIQQISNELNNLKTHIKIITICNQILCQYNITNICKLLGAKIILFYLFCILYTIL